jgi:hypothetical protein
MRTAFFIIAGVLAIAWILGFFFFNAGMLVHVFAISSLLSFMQGIISVAKPEASA